MKTIQKIVILMAVVLIFLSVLFPPFAAGKLPVGENIHSGIGYHPVWNRPTAEHAWESLYGQKYDRASGEDLSDYFVMLNKVGLIIQVMFILLITSIMFIFFGRRGDFSRQSHSNLDITSGIKKN